MQLDTVFPDSVRVFRGQNFAQSDIQEMNIYRAAEGRNSKLRALNCLQSPKQYRVQSQHKSVLNRPPHVQAQTFVTPHFFLVYFKFRTSGHRPCTPPQNAELVLFIVKPPLLNRFTLSRKFCPVTATTRPSWTLMT